MEHVAASSEGKLEYEFIFPDTFMGREYKILLKPQPINPSHYAVTPF